MCFWNSELQHQHGNETENGNQDDGFQSSERFLFVFNPPAAT